MTRTKLLLYEQWWTQAYFITNSLSVKLILHDNSFNIWALAPGYDNYWSPPKFYSTIFKNKIHEIIMVWIHFLMKIPKSLKNVNWNIPFSSFQQQLFYIDSFFTVRVNAMVILLTIIKSTKMILWINFLLLWIYVYFTFYQYIV